jgi:hypothetical protein
MRFTPSRRDQITCTPTCRQRMRRGGAFAYLTDLSLPERKRARRYHATLDQYIADCRQEDRTARAEAHQRRQQRHEAKRRDQLALVVGHVHLKQEQEQHRRHLLMSVSAYVARLAQQGREITPAAIAAFFDNQFAEDEVATTLAEMRASGQYEHDVARGVAMRADATSDTN